MATYYPKSQIKTNLYTNGDEYMIASTKQEYTGPYYEISNGKKFVGNIPSPQRSIEIIPIISGVSTPNENGREIIIADNYDSGLSYISPKGPINNDTYNKSLFGNRSLPKSRYMPSPSITLPTPQDYKNGRMIRYFAKKTNELRYLETSKQTYTDLNSRSSNIAWDLYEPVQIQWIISGFEKQQVNDYNTIIVRDIERKKKWNGFSKFLKEDYTKYYKNLSA